MKEQHIKEIRVDQIELDDLDLVVQDELLGNNPDGHDCTWERDEKNQHNWAEHLSIPLLEDVIAVLKKKGATHIQIESNGDHHAYIFTGTKLEVLSEKEIKEKVRAKLERAIGDTEKSIKGYGSEREKSKLHLEKLQKKLLHLQ